MGIRFRNVDIDALRQQSSPIVSIEETKPVKEDKTQEYISVIAEETRKTDTGFNPYEKGVYEKVRMEFDNLKKSGIDIEKMPDGLKRGILGKIGSELAKEQISDSLRQEARYGDPIAWLGSKALDSFGLVIREAPRGIARTLANIMEIDASLGDKLYGENFKPYTDLLRKGSNAINDYLDAEGLTTRIKNKITEDEQERIQDMYANGEWGNLLAEYIADAVFGTIAEVTKMSLLPGGMYGRATGVDKIKGINLSALARAGQMGLSKMITTDGDIKEQFKAGALLSLFASTSAISSLAPQDWQAKVLDVLLNTGLSLTKLSENNYWGAIDRAKQACTKPDGSVDLNWGILIAELARVGLSDIVFGVMQESAKARKIKVNTAELNKKIETELVKQKAKSLTEKQKQDIFAFIKRIEEEGLKPIEQTEVQDAIQKNREGQIQEPIGENIHKETGENVLRNEGVQRKTEEVKTEQEQTKNIETTVEVKAEEKPFTGLKIANDAVDVLENIKKAPDEFQGILTRLNESFKNIKEGTKTNVQLEKISEREIVDTAKVFADEKTRSKILNILTSDAPIESKIYKSVTLLQDSISNSIKAGIMNEKNKNKMPQPPATDIAKRKNDIERIRKAIELMRPKSKEEAKIQSLEGKIQKQKISEAEAEENRKLASEYISLMFKDSVWQKTAQAKTAMSALKKGKLTEKKLAEVLDTAEKYAEWALRKDILKSIKRQRSIASNNVAEWDKEHIDGFKQLFDEFDARTKVRGADGNFVDNEAKISGIKKAVDTIRADEELKFLFEEEDLKQLENIADKKIKDYTSDDLDAVNKLMAFVNRQHFNKRSIFLDGKKQTIEEVKGKILEGFANNKTFVGTIMRTNFLKSYIGAHLQLLTKLRMINPQLADIVKNIINEGVQVKNKLTDQLSEMLNSRGISMSPTEWTRFTDTFSRTGIKSNLSTEYREIKFENMDKPVKLTPAQIASLYLTLKDEYAYNQLTKGGLEFSNGEIVTATIRNKKQTINIPRLTDNDVETLKNSLTPKEKLFADTVFDWHNTYVRETLDDGARQNLGYELSDGKPHWSIKRDSLFVRDKSEFKITEMQQPPGAELKRPAITKKRTGGNAPILIDDLMIRIGEEAGIVHAYKAFNLPFTTVRKLLRDPDIAMAIKQTGGEQWYNSILNHFSAMIGSIEKSGSGMTIETFVNEMTNRAAAGVIALSPSAIMQQPIAILTASNVLGVDILNAIKKPYLNRKESMLIQKMMEYNTALQERVEGHQIGREIGAAINRSTFLEKITGYKPIVSKQFSIMEKADEFAMKVVSIAAARRTARQMGISMDDVLNKTYTFKKVELEYMKRASDLAWDAINEGGQGVYHPVFRSEFQLSNSWLKRVIGVFHSQRDQYIESLVNAHLNWREGKISTPEYSLTVLVGAMLPIAMQVAIKQSVQISKKYLSDKDNTIEDIADEQAQKDRIFKYYTNVFGSEKAAVVADFLTRCAVELGATGYGGELLQVLDGYARYGETSIDITNNPFFSVISQAIKNGVELKRSLPDPLLGETLDDMDKDKAFKSLTQLIFNGLNMIGVSTKVLQDISDVVYKRYFSEK